LQSTSTIIRREFDVYALAGMWLKLLINLHDIGFENFTGISLVKLEKPKNSNVFTTFSLIEIY